MSTMLVSPLQTRSFLLPRSDHAPDHARLCGIRGSRISRVMNTLVRMGEYEHVLFAATKAASDPRGSMNEAHLRRRPCITILDDSRGR